MRLKYLHFVTETTGHQYLTSCGLCDQLNILLFFLGLGCIISVPPDMKHFVLIFNYFNFL